MTGFDEKFGDAWKPKLRSQMKGCVGAVREVGILDQVRIVLYDAFD